MDLRESKLHQAFDIGLKRKEVTHLDHMNRKILDRHFPDMALKPNINVRPSITRCTLFPVLNSTIEPSYDKPMYLDHHLETNFAPCQSNGPVNSSDAHINTENALRGQNIPLHHGNLDYIPSLESDLYQVQMPTPVESAHPQMHPLLFEQPKFHPYHHPNVIANKIGNEMFHNHTRTQLRQI